MSEDSSTPALVREMEKAVRAVIADWSQPERALAFLRLSDLGMTPELARAILKNMGLEEGN